MMIGSKMINWSLISWINGSLTPSVLAIVARSPSSPATWSSLEKCYASQSHNQILQLQSELLHTTRGDLYISNYLDKVNIVADNLALAGHPVSDDDLVAIIMNNVGPLYENTVSSAQARDTPITYDTLEALLLSAKRRLNAQNSLVDSGATALVASRPRGGGRGGRVFQSGGRHSFSGGRASSHMHPSMPTIGGRGFSSSSRTGSVLGPGPSQGSFSTQHGGQFSQFHGASTSQTPRLTCQICGRGGHSALDCFSRLNLAYEGRTCSHSSS
ncbi:uncharacterized protein LOC112199681 [Rosa chinensis]|uniref:uncharacterized protein LOC112199681 n=1 Tax=Rosa chinensis TaxID=74649 RepID=UPI000D08C699|nr:uncharacterized protein LOC112199681 [Rosa chinensis]